MKMAPSGRRPLGHAPLVLAAAGLAQSASAQEPYEIAWMRTYSTPETDAAVAVGVDASGNARLFGDTREAGATGNDDVFLVRYDQGGAQVWTVVEDSFQDDYARAIAVDPLGSAYTVGETFGGMAHRRSYGQRDGFLLGYSPSASIIAAAQLGTHLNDSIEAVALGADGSRFLAGYTEGGFAGFGADDVFVAKYDTETGPVWIRNIGTPEVDRAGGVVADSAGAVYIAGHTFGNLGAMSSGSADALLARFDADGNESWVRQTGTPDADRARGVAVDSRDNVYITGYSDDGTLNLLDAFLDKYDGDGNLIWSRTRPLSRSFGVAVDAFDNVYVAGMDSAGPYFVKFDADGNELISRSIGASFVLTGMAVHSLGDLFACGYAGDDAVLIKLTSTECYADCDTGSGPGVLDIFDFLCFQDAFVAGDPYADCDANSVFDIFDFLCFQDAFTMGCR